MKYKFKINLNLRFIIQIFMENIFHMYGNVGYTKVLLRGNLLFTMYKFVYTKQGFDSFPTFWPLSPLFFVLFPLFFSDERFEWDE